MGIRRKGEGRKKKIGGEGGRENRRKGDKRCEKREGEN